MRKIHTLLIAGVALCAIALRGEEKKIWPALPMVDALDADLRVAEPVAIGKRKQLFVDRYLVALADEVLFTMMAPRRHPENPVLSPEAATDGQFVTPGAVLWNESKKVFQLWYSAIHFESGEELQYPAYAESRDGLSWQRPVLNLVEFNGSKANNLIPGGGLVIRDDHDPNPARRYKAAGCGSDARSVNLGYSPDGMRDWQQSPYNPLFASTGDTHALFGWDERLHKYIGFFRPMGKRPKSLVRQQQRHIAVSFSDDGDHWSPMVPVIVPDEHDPPGTEFYRVAVIRYEDLFIGLLSVLHMDAALLDFNQPDPVGVEQTVDTQLVVSRDAVNWARVGNRAPWLAAAPYQSWDDMVVWTVTPILVGDEIRAYYGGFPIRHQLADLYSSVEKRNGRTRQGCIGLATLRRDGWVAVRPNARRNGTLVTRSLTFEGSALELNAQAAEGKILVEMLDAERKPLPGFSGVNGITITGDSLRHRVRWQRPFTEIGGKPVRLRFTLQGPVELYAFQFVGE